MCLCCFSFLWGKEIRVMKQGTRSLWRENVSLGWIFRGAQVGNCLMRDTTPKLTAAGGDQVNNEIIREWVSVTDVLWTVENELFTSAESQAECWKSDGQTHLSLPLSAYIQEEIDYSHCRGIQIHTGRKNITVRLKCSWRVQENPKNQTHPMSSTWWQWGGTRGDVQQNQEGAALCHRILGEIFSTHFPKNPKPCLKWVFPHQLFKLSSGH